MHIQYIHTYIHSTTSVSLLKEALIYYIYTYIHTYQQSILSSTYKLSALELLLPLLLLFLWFFQLKLLPPLLVRLGSPPLSLDSCWVGLALLFVLDSPKSVIIILAVAGSGVSKRRFSGLMSRCRMSWECNSCRPLIKSRIS